MSITNIKGTYNIGSCLSWVSVEIIPSSIDLYPVI